MSFVPASDEWEEDEPADPPCLEVDITEPVVVGRLLDIDGFGFQRSDDG